MKFGQNLTGFQIHFLPYLELCKHGSYSLRRVERSILIEPQARNEEKAQSMLYRFREAQAAELGLGTRSDRRPKMASACKSLRECERWRGEILREISRKVSKIQDGSYNLTGSILSTHASWDSKLGSRITRFGT